MDPLEIFEDKSDELRFRLRGGNGEIVHTSEGYTREGDANRGFDDLTAAVLRVLVGRGKSEQTIGEVLADLG